MMISKKQLVNGVVKFIEDDLIPDIGDRNMKFVLSSSQSYSFLHNNKQKRFLILKNLLLRTNLIDEDIVGDF